MSTFSPPELFDGYKVRRLLGKGGMGAVYLAHDTLLDRPVAVKFITTSKNDALARERFLVEARAIARLQHANVVSIYRVGEVGGVPYLVSEFIHGTPLDRLETPVSSEDALRIALDVASGLAAAHRRGVVHRDIKPANAIRSDDGTVKLLDFGIAKLLPQIGASDALEGETSATASQTVRPPQLGPKDSTALLEPDGDPSRVVVELDDSPASAAECEPQNVALVRQVSQHAQPPIARSERSASTAGSPARSGVDPAVAREAGPLTDPGIALGTPRYMAPEIWARQMASFRSDVYSFGALLYRLCSGRPPHDERDTVKLRQKVLTRDVEPLHQVAPQIDPALCAIIDRCLRRIPSERYASGSELRSALVSLLPEAREAAAPAGNPYRGLASFQPQHQNLYFGRDSEIRMVLERLAREPFVLIAGDSGVGKSSLCRAGVLPRVDRWFNHGQAKSRSWKCLTVIPGRHPVVSLANALAAYLQKDAATLSHEIASDQGGVARQLRAWGGQDRGLVIFVDQLEELLTLSVPDEAAATADLLGWLSISAPGLRVLATVRGDFLSRAANLPRVGAEVARALYFLRPLTAERIRDAITGPAGVTRTRFEVPELVESLVSSTRQAEAGLPLLQFALAELWEARDRQCNTITRESLQRIGGVIGALSKHADGVIREMLPDQREAARDVLLALVTSSGTRARKSDRELGSEAPAVRSAITALVRGRLLVAREAPEGAAYEIAHEALISGWTTLADWMARDADARRAHERLRLAVDEWIMLGRGREGLWSRRQLSGVAGIDAATLAADERTFIATSRRLLRASRVLRLTLILVALATLVGGYVGFRLQKQIEIARTVDTALRRASALRADAAKALSRANAQRDAALAGFDRGQLAAAEKQWRLVRIGRDRARGHLRAATIRAESALMIDGTRNDAKAMVADLLYERALLGELSRRPRLVAGLLDRLALYDVGGSRRARWQRPAVVSLQVEPAAATARLYRYSLDTKAHYRRSLVEGDARARRFRLDPGSYVLWFAAPGHQPARLPFVVERGRSLALSVRLLARDRVPAGFVHVPAGRMLLGSAAPDAVRRDFFHHVPLHEVTTPGFLIARHETTFADWIAFLKALPAEKRAQHLPRVQKGGFQGRLSLTETKPGSWQIALQPTTTHYVANEGQPIRYSKRAHHAVQRWRRLPVAGITAADALAYVRWLAKNGVPGARLCSGVQWERAARGADGRAYPHGERLHADDANHDATYRRIPAAMGPDEVGSFPRSRSPFGVDDMAGNVWEWTRSTLSDGRYAARGGSYYFGANSARVTDREVTEPSFRDLSVGLRVCADLPASGRRHARSARPR